MSATVRTAIVMIPAVLMAMLGVLSGAEVDHRLWDELVGRHVEQGVVDYQGFKKEGEQLDGYLAVLAATNPDQLAAEDQLAFYINAYNAYTVKLIVDNFRDGEPVNSIKKLGSFFTSPWEIEFAEIGGKTYTLDNIEHDIIRERFNEPRIHFAVNCASKSCPPLISEAYLGSTLDRQLEQSTRDFLMDSRHNYLEGDTLYASSIFKWYDEDFPDGTAAFFLKHTTGTLHDRLQVLGKDVTVNYLDYDWSLNNGPP